MSKEIAPDRIYDSLIDDELFASLPAELAAAYGGRSTMIQWHDTEGAVVLGYHGCLTDEQLATYANHFAADDPWLEAAVREQALNRATNLEELVPVSSFLRSSFYNEYLRPMGDDTARCLGLMVQNQFGRGVVAIQRGLSQHGYTDAQTAGVDRLAPHLRRMLAVRGRIASAERRLAGVLEMVDALPQAALLVRSDGSVVEANQLAAAFVKQGKSITIRERRVQGLMCAEDLSTAIRRACDPANASASAVPLGLDGVVVIVNPVKDVQRRQLALLLISVPPSSTRDAPRLQDMFGLTEAEAAVAIALSKGMTPAEISSSRGVSLHTVRVQLRSVYDKLGCRRQAEVASLVSRLS